MPEHTVSGIEVRPGGERPGWPPCPALAAAVLLLAALPGGSAAQRVREAADLVRNEGQMAEPVTFEFVRMSGPAEGRKTAYDADKKRYFLTVKDIARFRVKAVAADVENRPVILVISGMLDKPEGPLTLRADGKEFSLAPDKANTTLFKVERKDGVTTIEFLPPGRKLLKPGAEFQYIDFYR